MIVDKLPPHDIDAERAALGCQLWDPTNCIPAFCERFKEAHLAHYDLRHQIIQKTFVDMVNNGEPVDIITLQQKLRDSDNLEKVGGLTYLMEIQNDSVSPATLPFHLEVIEGNFLLRNLISKCTRIVGEAYERKNEVQKIIDQAEKEILSLRPVRSNFKPVKFLVNDVIAELERRMNQDGSISGLSTGLLDLDEKTDGLHNGEFIVIGAPTSCGKTALAMNIIAHNALSGIPAGFLSAEMTASSLALRALCAEAKANHRKIYESDCPRLTSAAGRIANAPLFIDSVNGMTIGQVRSLARRWKQQHGIKILAVENIQLLSGTGNNREQEIADISRGLRGMALELDIAVLGLSQLNDDGKLRESRAIGHDSDSAWILSNDGDWKPLIQPVKLRIEKCRHGETGVVPLTFLKEYTKFESVAKTEEPMPDYD